MFRVETGFIRHGERSHFARMDLPWRLAKPLYDDTRARFDEYVLLQKLDAAGHVIETLDSKSYAAADSELGGWEVTL